MFAKTVSSFSSVSLNPLLVSVCVAAASPLVAAIHASSRFAVSVLRREQQAISQHFAAPGNGRAAESFPTVPMTSVATGAPVVDDCLSYFDCRLDESVTAGDHQILVGRALAAGASSGEPLVYYRSGYQWITAFPDGAHQ
ncbi:flavin reductase family protein [Kutzneria sp. 744]|uniref:flavin reductase family protein n=1 Tax=Kutzneria sp. (strain 744) TaxID=345341 RepID=UPI0003EEC5C2|nr:nitrilotriacetate monooxygenase component B [Kutzneria sp. 744]